MASSSTHCVESGEKPVTRKQTEIWLVGQISPILNATKLPSKNEVMALFFHYKQIENKTVRDACHATAVDVLEMWAKAHIPTRLKKHVVDKVESMFREWEKLRKNKENKAKRSEGLQQKENEWKEGLEDLFDIAHADTMELMTIEEDKEFLQAQRKKGRPGKLGSLDTALLKKEALAQKRQEDKERRRKREEADRMARAEQVVLMSSSSEAEQQETEDEGNEGLQLHELESHNEPSSSALCPTPTGPTPAKKGRVNLFDTKLSMSLDAAKVSDRGAAVVLTPVLQCLGHDPHNFNISYSSIRRQRIKHRQSVAQCLKSDFKPTVPLTIHWDGKLLEDITGQQRVDRLPILVSGERFDQLLAVPKLPAGTGEAAASAVFECAISWGLCDRIKAMSFDTTAVNTGRHNGACVLLEQKMQKDMLWLACRHHILEIVLEAVVMSSIGPSKSPDTAIFKRFKERWPFIDKMSFQTASTDEPGNNVSDVADEMIAFAQNQLTTFQPRDDYRELLELVIIFLGGMPAQGISFKQPAGLHRARWMAKAIYALKIWMFRGQFRLTAKEEGGFRNICIFTTRIYTRAWFTAPSAVSAPRNDLWLIKSLHRLVRKYSLITTDQ